MFPDFFTATNHELIIQLAAQHHVPATYPYRYFAAEGGFMSYGVNTAEEFRRAAAYVDQILRGANPGNFRFRRRINSSSSSTSRPLKRLASLSCLRYLPLPTK